METLWQGTWATKLRIASGLVLFFYVLLHFLNIGAGAISPEAANAVQAVRSAVFRSLPGTVLIYGAVAVHMALSLAKVALSDKVRLSSVDWMQIAFGLTIPVLLATHVVFTRRAADLYDLTDTVGYLSGLIWDSDSGWKQAFLLLITWAHGCIGLHMWLRVTRWWNRNLVPLAMLGIAVPAFALAGFATEGRRVYGLLRGSDEDARLDFYDEVNWPGPGEFAELVRMSDQLWWVMLGVVALPIAAFGVRRLLAWSSKSLQIDYVDGPSIKCAPGPTLLEISQNAGVPHLALCGGRGRCTTCRVVVDSGSDAVSPPTEAEMRALRAAKAPRGARLACQLRPEGPLRVYRLFGADGKRLRNHATDGKEAQLAILFLDMRGFTSRTTGQLPYDVVYLLNRFFDAIVPPINAAGGTVDKYLGDGLLAVFELPSAEASAQASLRAAKEIGAALETFNESLQVAGEDPVRIGLSLHLGNVVLGEIGAAGQAPRTLIGDTVNTASRIEAETKALGVEGLISESVLETAGMVYSVKALKRLELRGVAEPVPALPVPRLSELGF